MARGNNNKQQFIQSDDSSSPFFLQSGDTPGLILVSEPLTGLNYQKWSRSILVALKARNKVPFIDGSIEQPEVGDLLFGAWERCNSMVVTWLSKVVSSDIASSLLYLDTAKEIWDDLYVRFSQANVPLSQQQYQQLVAMLSSKFQPIAAATPSIPSSPIMHENPSASSFIGSFSGEDDWDG